VNLPGRRRTARRPADPQRRISGATGLASVAAAAVLPAAVLLASVLLAGCGGGAVGVGSKGASPDPAGANALPWVPGVGGAITLGIDQPVAGCNPNAIPGGTWAASTILEPVLPSPFVVNPDGESVYDSAVISQAEVVNTAPQTVVYSINPAAVWSDGVPLTAADFVYAWRHQVGSTGGGASAGAVGTQTGGTSTATVGYRDIASVTGSGDGRTVTVVFKQAFADWEMLFNDLLPAQVMQKAGWDPACTTVEPQIDLSAGPFAIQSATSEEIVLVRNPRWWGQTPNLDRIVVKIAKSPAQLARWLSVGKVQVVQPRGLDEVFLERVTGAPDVSSTADLSTRFVQLVFSTTGPSTANVSVRRALAFAIDRQDLVNQVVGWVDTGIAPAASHLYAQSQGAYPGPVPPPVQVAATPSRPQNQAPLSSVTTPTPSRPFPRTADPTETTRLLDAAGDSQTPSGTWRQPDGSPVTVRVAVDQHDQWAAQAGSVIVAQLNAAGFDATEIPAQGGTAAGEDLATGAADAAVLAFSGTPYPSEAISWYTPELGPPGSNGSQDWSNFDDPNLNQLLNRAARQLNPVTAKPLYTQADMLLWSQMVALPLFTEPDVLAWSNFTAGISANPMGPGLLWYPETWAIRVPPGSSNTVPG